MIELQTYPNSDEPDQVPMYLALNPDQISSVETYRPPYRTLEGSTITTRDGKEHHVLESYSAVLALLAA